MRDQDHDYMDRVLTLAEARGALSEDSVGEVGVIPCNLDVACDVEILGLTPSNVNGLNVCPTAISPNSFDAIAA